MLYIDTDIISAGDKPPPYGYVHHYFFTNALIITVFFGGRAMGLACGLGHILALALSTQFTTKMPLRYPYDISFAATSSFIIHYSLFIIHHCGTPCHSSPLQLLLSLYTREPTIPQSLRDSSPAGSVTSGSDSPPDCHSIPSVSLRYPLHKGACVLTIAIFAPQNGGFFYAILTMLKVSSTHFFGRVSYLQRHVACCII